MFTSITNLLVSNTSNDITLKINSYEEVSIGFNYYLNNKIIEYEYKGIFNPKGSKEYTFNCYDQEFDTIVIELIVNGEVQFETSIKITKTKINKEIDLSIENEYNELIDIEYNLVEEVTINHENKYKFKKMEDLVLPRIVDITKLELTLSEYKDASFNDAYLLFNKGFKGSDLETEYDFYKVPINIKRKNNEFIFSLSEDYFYDFNDGVLKKEKTNNSTKVNELILSRDDDLISEAYLVINEFGFVKNKVNIDLLLKEPSFFGEDGYYCIKEIR